MVLDIVTGLVNDANAMILAQVLLDLPLMWQTGHPKEEVKATP
jgi:hypothetical protein